MIVVVLMAIAAIVLLYAICWFIIFLTGHNPETGKKINRLEYLQEIQERERIRSGKLTPDEVRSLEDYLIGKTCIGLSPNCVGRKSKTAVVCSMCYRAQGRNNPIGFAQSGGGATREQLIRKVLGRLSEAGRIDSNTLPARSVDSLTEKKRSSQTFPVRMQKGKDIILTMRGKYVDFVIPVLKTLDSLGGRAWLSDIEQEFYQRYHSFLDPAIDWHKMTGNHNKQLWQDCCGSRVTYWQLKPNGYVTIERHGNRGSIWSITQLGREKIKETA
jgi:hypothetical protein